MYAALDPELNAALNGQKTAQQALDDAAERMQQVLDRS
jgi:ABC-type glycerol-3-phosphate transport system substrate-binding protein